MSPWSSSAVSLLLKRTISTAATGRGCFFGKVGKCAVTARLLPPSLSGIPIRMKHKDHNESCDKDDEELEDNYKKPKTGFMLDQNHSRNPHGWKDEELDEKYEAFFSGCDIDGWDMRQAMNEIAGLDFVPSPQLIIAVLQCCRKNNDYACAIRFLESVKDKCGNKVEQIYPWLIQEIAPTLYDLGVDTPEGLGYDVPELALKDDTYD